MASHSRDRVVTEFPSELGLSPLPHGSEASPNHYQSQQLSVAASDDGLDESRKTKLYLLLIRAGLEEKGYRRQAYQRFLPRDVSRLSFRGVQEVINDVCQRIIEDAERHNPQQQSLRRPSSARSLQMRRLASSDSNRILKQISEPLFVCPVCYEEVYEAKLTKRLVCGHRFCDDCLTGNIDENINEAKYEMVCLEIECNQPFSEELVREALPRERYDRYRYFKRKKEMEANPNNKFCTKPNCDGLLQQHEDSDSCPICQTKYCRTCSRTFHTGSCQAQLQHAIDTVYDKLKIKKCPKCKSPIEKAQGCNHMTCKKCSHQFCWICLKQYTRFHYRYYNCFGCPGMQFQDQRDMRRERCKQALLFLLLPLIVIGLLVLALLFLPLYMIAMMFIKTYHKAIECSPSYGCCAICCNCDDQECCTGCNHWGCTCFLFYLLFFPVGVLYGIFFAPIKYIILLVHQAHEILV